MKSFVFRATFAVICTLMILTINVIPGTEAGRHGDHHGIAEILASGIIVSLLKNGRRRRSLEDNHQPEWIY